MRAFGRLPALARRPDGKTTDVDEQKVGEGLPTYKIYLCEVEDPEDDSLKLDLLLAILEQVSRSSFARLPY